MAYAVGVAMNARLKQALPRPDEWNEFRPEEFSRRSSRSVGLKLLLSVALVSALLLIWVILKPQIRGTMTQIRKAISGPEQSPVKSSRKRHAGAAGARRDLRATRDHRPEQPTPGEAAPGPFEVYLLDGDRYIRVDASDRSVLLNTQTGETTWIDSDTMAENRR